MSTAHLVRNETWRKVVKFLVFSRRGLQKTKFINNMNMEVELRKKGEEGVQFFGEESGGEIGR